MLLAEVDVVDACGEEPAELCRWVARQSWGTEFWAVAADWVIDKPLRVAIIVAVGFVVVRLLRRSVRRFGERLTAKSERETMLAERRRKPGEPLPLANGRSQQRRQTLISVLTSVVSIVAWAIVALLVLGTFDVTLAPLLAGAGVLGIVLAFGAQTIVADFLSGVFMLIEDQFGVGDVIDVGEVTGTVEKVSLRVTTLRDVNGAVWHVPNSEIRRVSNKSQLWSRAVLDIDVAYDTDLRRAEGIIQRVADELWGDSAFEGGDIIEPPEVWGIERLGADGVTIRLVVKTDPAEQWIVARELRLRIKEGARRGRDRDPLPPAHRVAPQRRGDRPRRPTGREGSTAASAVHRRGPGRQPGQVARTAATIPRVAPGSAGGHGTTSSPASAEQLECSGRCSGGDRPEAALTLDRETVPGQQANRQIDDDRPVGEGERPRRTARSRTPRSGRL